MSNVIIEAMTKLRLYRHTIVSIIIIIIWFVIVFRYFNSGSVRNDKAILQFIWTWITTISIAILFGIGMHLITLIKGNGWEYKFAYNLIATFNVIIGCFGMMLPRNIEQPTPYLIASSFAVGVIMFRKIYGRNG